MQKVLSINLAGSVFQIDEDAYTILHQYVESIRTHFKNTQSGAEIANDIEQRLAEMILGRQKTGNLLVNKIIVEEIIALMGKDRKSVV